MFLCSSHRCILKKPSSRKGKESIGKIFTKIWIKEKIVMTGLIAIGAAVAVITGVGAGIGIGMATSKAVDAIARQPEADGKITKALLLGCALAEATAIYGFVIGLLIILFLK